jgi:heat shock protein HspQ
MKKAIIIDIDNCWMDSRLWISKAPMESKDERDWDIFYKKVHLCAPNKAFISDVITLISEMDLYPIFVTSRSENVKMPTIHQIQSNSSLIVGKSCLLYMRKKNIDYRSSDKVKKDIVSSLMDEYEVVYCIDDDDKNLKVFKELNIPMVIKYNISKHDYERI